MPCRKQFFSINTIGLSLKLRFLKFRIIIQKSIIFLTKPKKRLNFVPGISLRLILLRTLKIKVIILHVLLRITNSLEVEYI